MLSTPSMKETDPHGPVVIDPEVVLATRPDRTTPAAGPDAVRRPADRQSQAYHAAAGPALDTTFRATDVNAVRHPGGRSPIATWAVRTVLVVLFGVCSAVAAAAWQSYGDQAQEVIAHWVPRISLTSTSADKSTSPTQPAVSSAQTADDQAATTQVQQATDGALPATAATGSQDQTQLLQSMAHDLAAMGQQIGDLKASLAQLKAGQEQMTRDMGRISEAKAAERTSEARPFDPKAIEQTLRPRPAPVAARPAAASTAVAAVPVHRPRPTTYPSTQTTAAPMPLQSAPAQATADDGLTVVRPPTPLR
jgi:hypothetical protein